MNYIYSYVLQLIVRLRYIFGTLFELDTKFVTLKLAKKK